MKHLYLKKFASDIQVLDSGHDDALNRLLKLDKSLYNDLNKPLTFKSYNPFNVETYAGKALALANAVPDSSSNKKKIKRLANRIASNFVIRDALLSAIPLGAGILGGVAAAKALGGSPLAIPALALPAGLGAMLGNALNYKLKANRYNKLRHLVSMEPNLDLTDLAYAPLEKGSPMIHTYNKTIDKLNELYDKQLRSKVNG